MNYETVYLQARKPVSYTHLDVYKRQVYDHDNNKEHINCLKQYLSRGTLLGRVDKSLMAQYQEEVAYWRKVLERVVETIKFLVSRGLPFRGENETIGSVKNGNFLGCIELIAKFDPFMADHLARYGNKGRGVPSYLSSTTVDELVLQLEGQVKMKIKEEVVQAKYFSIVVDSMPDVSNTDQLTFIVRYVLPDGTPVERFITFLPNTGHKGENLVEAVTTLIGSSGLDLNNCRGESYGNASNMSGCYKGCLLYTSRGSATHKSAGM